MGRILVLGGGKTPFFQGGLSIYKFLLYNKKTKQIGSRGDKLYSFYKSFL